MITSVVCGTCGKTAEYNAARAGGWLIHQRKDAPEGYLIIRCPEHITEYARRLAGLPQQDRTRRLEQNLDRGLWANYGDGYTASVWYDLGAAALSPEDKDDPDLGEYIIQYHAGEMPPFNAQRFRTLAELIAAMRGVEPDLRKWRLTEIE